MVCTKALCGPVSLHHNSQDFPLQQTHTSGYAAITYHQKIHESAMTRAVKNSHMLHCNKDISHETVASYHPAAREESWSC